MLPMYDVTMMPHHIWGDRQTQNVSWGAALQIFPPEPPKQKTQQLQAISTDLTEYDKSPYLLNQGDLEKDKMIKI